MSNLSIDFKGRIPWARIPWAGFHGISSIMHSFFSSLNFWWFLQIIPILLSNLGWCWLLRSYHTWSRWSWWLLTMLIGWFLFTCRTGTEPFVSRITRITVRVSAFTMRGFWDNIFKTFWKLNSFSTNLFHYKLAHK